MDNINFLSADVNVLLIDEINKNIELREGTVLQQLNQNTLYISDMYKDSPVSQYLNICQYIVSYTRSKMTAEVVFVNRGIYDENSKEFIMFYKNGKYAQDNYEKCKHNMIKNTGKSYLNYRIFKLIYIFVENGMYPIKTLFFNEACTGKEEVLEPMFISDESMNPETIKYNARCMNFYGYYPVNDTYENMSLLNNTMNVMSIGDSRLHVFHKYMINGYINKIDYILRYSPTEYTLEAIILNRGVVYDGSLLNYLSTYDSNRREYNIELKRYLEKNKMIKYGNLHQYFDMYKKQMGEISKFYGYKINSISGYNYRLDKHGICRIGKHFAVKIDLLDL